MLRQRPTIHYAESIKVHWYLTLAMVGAVLAVGAAAAVAGLVYLRAGYREAATGAAFPFAAIFCAVGVLWLVFLVRGTRIRVTDSRVEVRQGHSLWWTGWRLNDIALCQANDAPECGVPVVSRDGVVVFASGRAPLLVPAGLGAWVALVLRDGGCTCIETREPDRLCCALGDLGVPVEAPPGRR